MIAAGFDTELDRLRGLERDGGSFLIQLETRERERTGIANLKVGYNRVHGYYIEVSRLHSERVPAEYHRRQTLKSVERYITEELKQFEDQVLRARDLAAARERTLYEALLDRVCDELPALQACAAAVAEIDVLAAFAERTVALDLVRPEFDDEAGIDITEGRHPVVEQIQSRPFIPNDVRLSDGVRMLVITGPNMGGKSTFMRQVALIVLLAHMGSFVPARSAKIGPVDRIFTRIGAGDDVAGGRSTFMVEMTETANILNNATDRSLVIVDEIGRGTSTYDGLALAWACAAHLATQNRAFTLFATHFFELTALSECLGNTANVHLSAVEHGERIVFLHAVRPGPADRSYGLHVAQLAGLPRPVIEMAAQRLQEMETGTMHHVPPPPPQHDLFREPEPALELLRETDPDSLSPREALELLYRLRGLIAE